MNLELSEAITALIDWYDKSNDGGEPTINALDGIVKDLQAQQPYPPGELGDDLHIITSTNSSRPELLEAIQRLRHTPLTLL